MENLINMEEPTPCIHCTKIFELSKGYESEKWHPNITICLECYREETHQILKDEEIEDFKENIADAEDTIERYRKRLKELGVYLPETKAEKWDKLDEEIAKFYPDESAEDDMEDDGLIGIGEVAAKAFGYL